MNKDIIDNAPKDATHYAVHRGTGDKRYVALIGSEYVVLPKTKCAAVLAYNLWDIYKLT